MRAFLIKRWRLLVAGAVIVGTPAAWLLASGPAPDDLSIAAAVRRGVLRRQL